MPENVNIKAALENLWDVVNEEGFELAQFDHDVRRPDGSVEIVRAIGSQIGVDWDTVICAVPKHDTPS